MLAETVGPTLAAVGWIGQACFFARFFVQWLASERAGRSLVPRAFWWLTLGGSLLMTAYALRQHTHLLLPGFVVGAAIAVRNLLLERRREALDARLVATAAVLAVAVALVIELGSADLGERPLWLMVGVLGQALWVVRFPVQWWLSERAGFSHFPLAFWRLSLAGNLLLLAYALHLGDPVFVLGFLPGPLLQIRNLVLARRGLAPA